MLCHLRLFLAYCGHFTNSAGQQRPSFSLRSLRVCLTRRYFRRCSPGLVLSGVVLDSLLRVKRSVSSNSVSVQYVCSTVVYQAEVVGFKILTSIVN